MRQSRKEQGLKRAANMLLEPDMREARILAETDMEAAEEWEAKPGHARRGGHFS